MPNPGPLDGTLILDLSRDLAGPYAAQLLGDLGADIIKVEQPEVGDEIRTWPPFFHDTSCYYLISNRNKRAMTLNLKSPAGREVVRKLVERADVLVENFKPGTMERLGLGPSTLMALNPRLVYCAITGFGADGPYAARPGYDAAIQAMTGVMSVTGDADRPPVRAGVAVIDFGTALFAAYAMQAALLARVRTGRGQLVETSLFESGIALMSYQAATYFMTGTIPRRIGSTHPAMAPLRVFDTADDPLLAMAANDKQWAGLCTAIEAPDLLADPRFTTNDLRVQHKQELHDAIQVVLLRRPRAEWMPRLEAAGVVHAPVNSIDQAMNDPQTLARSMVAEIDHPRLGPFKVAGIPVKLQDTPATIRTPPPDMGQHTDTILAELGYDQAAIEQMHTSGAV